MKRCLTWSLAILSVFALSAFADSNFRIKLSSEVSDLWGHLSKVEEPDPNTQGLLNFRYLWSTSNDHLAFDLQLVSELNYTPERDRNLWLLSVPQVEIQDRAFWTYTQSSNHSLIALVDRAQITYKNNSFRASLGRFPNSWGRGLMFHPLDVFNAFAPTLVDREFKRGNDSMLIEYVFNSSAELQFLATVRKQVTDFYRSNATYAVKYSVPLGNTEFEAVGAVHYEDEIFGFSSAMPIADLVLRADVVCTCLYRAACHVSGVVNIDYTFSVLRRPIYVFGEYFYNGIGVRDLSLGYSTLSKAHSRRLDRGDLFSLGRNLVAIGTFVTWHPLWNQTVALLANTNDRSTLLQTFISFTPTDHASLNVGARLPFGDTNEEFGELFVDDELVGGGVAGVFAEFIYYR